MLSRNPATGWRNKPCVFLKKVYHFKMEAKNTHGGARAGVGRKRLQPGVATVPVMIKMTELQKGKLKRLGGAPWVRNRIDEALEPTDQQLATKKR